MTAYAIERRVANRVPPAPPAGDAFGLRATIDAILQHGRLALTIFLLVLGAALAYALLAAPVYRADTILQIDSRPRTLLQGLQTMPGSAKSADEDKLSIAGEIEILRSRELLIPVIEATGADIVVGDAWRHGYLPVGARHGIDVVAFRLPESQRGRPFALRVASGRWTLADDTGHVLATGAVGQPQPFAVAGENASLWVNAASNLPRTEVTLRLRKPLQAYEDVLNRLRLFEPSRESNVVRISLEDERPARAAALLNLLVASYVTQTTQRRADEGAQALRYLEDQLPAVKARVEAAENALAANRNAAGVAAANAEADALLRQRGDLERQLVDLRVRRDLLAQTFTPEHRELAAVLAQISTVQRAMARLAGELKQLPVQQRDTVRLQRDAQIATQLYTTLLEQVQQLRLTGPSGLASARQLDRAAVPVQRSRPIASAVLSIGLGLGVVLALAAVLLVRALVPTVSDTQDLQSPTGLPTLAVIPESDAQRRLMEGRLKEEVVEDLGTHRLLVRAVPDDPAVDSLRSVHLSLIVRARTQESKVVLITSPSGATGKAFVASNLAALMAETGERVLLIEADLRRPAVHKFMLLDEYAAGLSDLLTDRRRLDQVIHTHATAGLDVMLHGTVTGNPGSLLMSHGLEVAMSDLRERYDRIVINAAPLSNSGDALAIGRTADLALLVVRAEQSLVLETRVAQRRLQQAGIKLEGLLFNGVKRKRLNAPVLT